MSAARLFPLPERGAIEVRGEDRVRWLDGMLTNDVAAAAATPGGGCEALLLTRQGRIVAQVHLLAHPDRIVLETARLAIPPALEAFGRLLVADDVALVDVSDGWARLALEGDAAATVLTAAIGDDAPVLAPGHHGEVELAGTAVGVAAFGFTGRPAFQLFVFPEAAPAVQAALVAAGAEAGDAPLFERLRIEAGVPLQGAEIDDSVLPDEAQLGDAVSTTKGCYIGQEVVARMRSRNRVSHRLVGLRLGAPAKAGAAILEGERKLGEVTSATISPEHGPIALGYLPAARAEPGGEVRVDGHAARVVALPFTSAGS